MVNLKIFRYFSELVQSFQNESAFGQTINMGRLCDYLQGWRGAGRDLSYN